MGVDVHRVGLTPFMEAEVPEHSRPGETAMLALHGGAAIAPVGCISWPKGLSSLSLSHKEIHPHVQVLHKGTVDPRFGF